MGYDLHITRAKLWFNSEDDPITLDEWKAYVAGDPEMTLEGEIEGRSSDSRIAYKNSGLAVWTKDFGRVGWFDHRKGKISVKNPDREVALKMLDVAKALNAGLVGDEGEDYTDAGVFERGFPK
jgi:hypothetical protein